MATAYVGEIRMFASGKVPNGWALCDGSLLSVNAYPALYSLISTTYGGDGVNNFALPDLRGRLPIHVSSQYPMGSKAGTEKVTLTTAQLPNHTHPGQASSAVGTSADPTNAFWAASTGASNTNFTDGVGVTLTSMSAAAVSSVGSNGAHDNMMPSFTLNFIIALNGEYPNLQ
ncbi:phage tail protein [Tumebacillus sp. ITR2]|uniref:Phage tail protein n=1 Tax=Tumebacillus amylolyticus TaxID=2801339 RepID=A0ABS1J6J3_9BACL|nr:tail fiber protein [Tumebacillus amylolyticus]MBL0385893.1 phage tail protein [Tumebacillus amylolyticus]